MGDYDQAYLSNRDGGDYGRVYVTWPRTYAEGERYPGSRPREVELEVSLPHQCDQWRIGGAADARALAADLVAAAEAIEAKGLG